MDKDTGCMCTGTGIEVVMYVCTMAKACNVLLSAKISRSKPLV